jgi:nitric oxide reductase subunit C
MTKRQTRFFFFAGTLVFTLVFVALTIDSHRQFDRLTNADQITSAVIEGKHVWHRKNCINCHTLLGEGAYYAPDLTRITTQRGAAYLQQFLKDPSKFYSEERDRRLMPNQDLSDADITNLIAFLDWVSRIENQGWPPRPILVSGETIPGSNIGGQAPAAPASADPEVLGSRTTREGPSVLPRTGFVAVVAWLGAALLAAGTVLRRSRRRVAKLP